MEWNLKIDWLNQSDEYTNLIGNYYNVKKEILKNPEPIKNNDSNEDSIEVMKVMTADLKKVITIDHDLIKNPSAKKTTLWPIHELGQLLLDFYDC